MHGRKNIKKKFKISVTGNVFVVYVCALLGIESIPNSARTYTSTDLIIYAVTPPN